MFKKDDKVKVVKGIKAFEGLTGTVLDTNGNQVKVKLNLSNDSELQKNLINVFEAYQLELESLDLLKEDTPTFDNDVEPEKKICCICGEEYTGYGNNAEPYKEGYCCDECNKKFVIPSRLGQKSLDEGFSISFNGAVACAKEDIEAGKTKEEFIQHMQDEFKLPKKTYNDAFFDKVWDAANEINESLNLDEGYFVASEEELEKDAWYANRKGKTKEEWINHLLSGPYPWADGMDYDYFSKIWDNVVKTNESLKLTEDELKAWCSDNDANYYTQDIKDDKVIIRGLNEDLAEYDFKTKELKVFDYSGTTTPETKEDENDDNYIRDYVYDIDMIDEKTEIPSWEFASVIATAEDTTEDAVVTEAHDRGFKVYLITASEYEKLVVASEKITEDDIMDDFASYLEGNPKVTEVI